MDENSKIVKENCQRIIKKKNPNIQKDIFLFNN